MAEVARYDTLAAAVPLAAATDADRADVHALVAACALPTAGLDDQFPRGYVVARVGADLIGVAGLERHGAAGLLRSVAVAPAARGTGLGQALVADRIAAARAAGLDALYLLTTTADGFFPRFGFAPHPRASVPAVIAASREFASACPAAATCLARSLVAP